MKTQIAAFVAASLLSTSAKAADWSEFYFGGNVGYGKFGTDTDWLSGIVYGAGIERMMGAT